MPDAGLNALIIDAPVGRHFAQVHADAKALSAAVRLFVETGVRREQPVLVVASPETTERLFSGLTQVGINAQTEMKGGRLRVLDASALMSRFMRGGMPSWRAFQDVVSEEFEDVNRSGSGTPRVYGEMVNLLWRDGKQAAAIQLEEFWNDLARLYPFSLFCGYTFCSHGEDWNAASACGIGRTHSGVVPTEDDALLGEAIDIASRELYGMSLDEMLRRSGAPLADEDRLPPGLRSAVWLRRARPELSAAVLERARARLRAHAALAMRAAS